MLACSVSENYNPTPMGLSVTRELVDTLRDPIILAEMHTIAERSHSAWSVNHALIRAVAGKVLDPIDAHYASVGVGVHEVVVNSVGICCTQPYVVSGRHNVAGLLVDSTKDTLGTVREILLGFHTVEPDFYETTEEIVRAHVNTPSTCHAAMIGAALSYSLQLSAIEL